MIVSVDLLRKLEWCSHRSGHHASYPMCPICFGIKTSPLARSEFKKSEIGHKKGCEMNAVLKQYGELTCS